jgi:hypothetical protein
MRLPPKSFPRACRLRNLARMEHFQQRRIDEQGLRLTYEFGEDLPPQRRFQVAPELLHPPVERGRVEPYHSRKQVREEPLEPFCVAQKKERSLSTPRSCWKSARAMTSESESRFMEL